jgi:hypothetical protein
MMGFTDEVRVQGPLSRQYIQVGNAVCPPVACGIAERIMRVMPHIETGKRGWPVSDESDAAVEGSKRARTEY